jgi:hypothetical protein
MSSPLVNMHYLLLCQDGHPKITRFSGFCLAFLPEIQYCRTLLRQNMSRFQKPSSSYLFALTVNKTCLLRFNNPTTVCEWSQ